jgi:hypothetical protein
MVKKVLLILLMMFTTICFSDFLWAYGGAVHSKINEEAISNSTLNSYIVSVHPGT